MVTKADMKATLEDAGIPLPENWAKMSLARAEAFTKTATKKPPVKRALAGMAAATMSAARAVAGLGAAALDAAEAFTELKETTTKLAYAQNTGTMPRDPKWKRSGSALGKHEFYPSYPAADPVPLTRQVRRQNERRASMMPIGARQSAWHALNGFGRIGSGV